MDDETVRHPQHDELVGQVAERRAHDLTAHQRSCAGCRARLVDLADLWSGVDAVGAEDVEVPAGLPDRVIARLRGRNHVDVVIDEVGGRTTVSSTVLTLIATSAIVHVPGLVRVHDVDVRPDGVALEVTLDLRRPLHDVAEAIRAAAADEWWRLTGMVPPGLDIHVRAVDTAD